MDDLAAREAEKYERMWGVDAYRNMSPGMRIFRRAREEMPALPGESLIDFGAGTGRAAMKWQAEGLAVTAVDHATNALDPEPRASLNFVRACLWDLPPNLRADWGYCTDVMEHIPYEKVDLTLLAIRSACRKGCFFQIATYPDMFGRQIGEKLHLTVRPAQWWEEKLRRFWGDVRMTGDRNYAGMCL